MTFFMSGNGRGEKSMIGGTIAIAKKSKPNTRDTLNRMIATTPNSNLIVAVPTSSVIPQRQIWRTTK